MQKSTQCLFGIAIPLRTRRADQLKAARLGVGIRIGKALGFSREDLMIMRGRRPSRVPVEIHLEEGVFQEFRAIAMKKEMSPEAFLNQLLNNIGKVKG